MANELAKADDLTLALIHGAFDGSGLPLPFTREIFLIETHIAGTTHVPAKDLEAGLAVDAPLVFRREPDNAHDKLAIRIHNTAGNKLGYVPRENNEILARLMDAGKFVFGKLVAKAWHGNWLRVTIRVFLRDL